MLTCIAYTLPQLLADLTPQERGKIVTSLVILMVIVLVGGAIILVIRRQIRDPDATNASPDTGFSLSELRNMRDRGEITPEEYERTRARIVSKVQSHLTAPPKRPPQAPPPADPL